MIEPTHPAWLRYPAMVLAAVVLAVAMLGAGPVLSLVSMQPGDSETGKQPRGPELLRKEPDRGRVTVFVDPTERAALRPGRGRGTDHRHHGIRRRRSGSNPSRVQAHVSNPFRRSEAAPRDIPG